MQQEFLNNLIKFVRHLNQRVVLDERERVYIMIGKKSIKVPDDDVLVPRVQDFKGLKKYIKLVQGEPGNSLRVYGFIDEFGNFLKAASWNAPAKHSRGNLFDRESWRTALTPYGFAYLR